MDPKELRKLTKDIRDVAPFILEHIRAFEGNGIVFPASQNHFHGYIPSTNLDHHLGNRLKWMDILNKSV